MVGGGGGIGVCFCQFILSKLVAAPEQTVNSSLFPILDDSSCERKSGCIPIHLFNDGES